MKIVFAIDSLIMGGAEKLALQYVQYLSQYHKIHLLINEDNGSEKNILFKYIPKNVTYSYVVDKNIIQKINFYREAKRNNIIYKLLYNHYLKKRRKSYKKNIIYILKNMNFDILIDFYCKIPLELCDKNTIVWLHTNMEKIKHKAFLYDKFRRVKKVIVINESMKKQIENHFPKLKNVELLYNPFDITKIKIMSKEIESLTQKEKLLLNNDYILSCSRLDKNKDIESLIYAYINLSQHITEKLYIMGEGPNYKNLLDIVIKNKMEDKIIFLGTKTNPYIWMKHCNLFVHSSKKEGFGMVIVEALINGCCVVATDCPIGPAEILDNGNCGILTPVGNIDKLEKSIIKGLNNKAMRAMFYKNSIIQIDKFSDVNILKRLNDIIKE